MKAVLTCLSWLICFHISACAAPRPQRVATNRLDIVYRSSPTSPGQTNLTGGEATAVSTAVLTYRKGIRTAVGSSCPMYPSDSALFDRLSQQCGIATAVGAAAARVFLEPAAPTSGLFPVVSDNRIRWYHLPETNQCGLLW